MIGVSAGQILVAFGPVHMAVDMPVRILRRKHDYKKKKKKMYGSNGRPVGISLQRCGGANDGCTPILGCTQEPRMKAAYCIDIVMCVREKKREKRRKGKKGRIERKGRIGGIGTAGALLY